jgi:hypothetical protein
MDISYAASESIKCYPLRSMRPNWLILVGISLLGCKDKPSAQPVAQKPPPGSAGSAVAAKVEPSGPSVGGAAINARDAPRLPEFFDQEQEDKDWATNTEQAINAVAPQLKNLECRTTECKGTLTAASPEELMKIEDKLQEPDGLPSTDAKNILLAGTPADGGMSTITVYVRYER